MIHARPFGLQCSEAISAYARLVKFNPSIPACAKLACNPLYLNVELITPDHHVVSQHEELSQWCILREVPYVRCLIGRNEKKFDYINRVVKHFRLQSTRVRRHTLPSHCYASPWIDHCVCVDFFSMQRFPTVASEPCLCVDDMHE